MKFQPIQFLRWFRPEKAPPVRARLQQVLVICHSGDDGGMEVANNLCVALEFGKIKFAMLDIGRQAALPQLDPFDSVIFATERIWQLTEEKTGKIEKYVRSGGGLFVACRCWCEELAGVFGMPADGPDCTMHTTSGLCFTKELFPGAAELSIGSQDWQFEHNRYDVEATDLAPDCTIVATDFDSRPVAWNRRYGAGRVSYWNTRALGARVLRGFALQSLLATMTAGAGAIAGFAVFHVDDFPASLSDQAMEPVTREYPGLDWTGFFFDVWRKDMMALREKYDLKYTWYVVMNYFDVENRPGAANAEATAMGADVLARRFAAVTQTAQDDEYGFHGYNHDPLTDEFWPDPALLETKLRLARDLWQDVVPAPMPTSWVPANNWYHPEHVQTLKRVFPEIDDICGLYARGDYGLGEYREFGPEPWEPSLTCLPRETCGYMLKPGIRMMMLSQIASMGIWTHFVHPDDIYDIPASPGDTAYHRNPDALHWKTGNAAGQPGLFRQLEDWIAEIRRLFPWLEFVTTSQAAGRLRDHVNSRADVLVGSDSVEIHSDAGGLFYLRTDREVALIPKTGGEILDSRPLASGVLHIVRCAAGQTSFALKNGTDQAPQNVG